jgi:hypothetical protein
MIRRAVRTVGILVAALTVPVALLAASAPAGAVSGIRLDETSGVFSVGAPQLCLNCAVEETGTGRLLQLVKLTNMYENRYYEYKIEFTENTSLCIGTAQTDPSGVYVVACSNGLGTAWALKPNNGSDTFINRAESQASGEDVYLTGTDNGSPFRLDIFGAPTGSRQRFTER